MKTKSMMLALTLLLGGAWQTLKAQHINAGASEADPAKLLFVNGTLFEAGSGYVRTLTFAPSGVFAGRWSQSPSFVALSNTNAIPTPAGEAAIEVPPPGYVAAALGSVIGIRIESIQGTPGATFGFWTNYNAALLTAMLVESVTLDSNGAWSGAGALRTMSDPAVAGQSSVANPYGHIHGQRYSVDRPGDYLVGFRVLDVSALGPGGGPFMESSDPYYMIFRAVPEPGSACGLLAAMALTLRRRREGRH
jgi:hypothetical protein